MLLAHSLIHDEQKGDFAAARKAAEIAIVSAGGAGRRASATLELASILTLRGDCHAAAEACREACALTDDPAIRLRATAIDIWNANTRWNFYPGGAGADAIEAWLQWPETSWQPAGKEGTEGWYQRKAFDYAGANEAIWNECYPKVPDGPDRLESEIIYYVLAPLPAARARILSSMDDATMQQQFQAAVHPMMYFLNRPGFQEAWPQWNSALTLLMADLAYRGRRYDLAKKLFGNAEALYSRAGDWAGAGACHLAEGDSNSGPFYSPATWHLAIMEGASADSADARVDVYEQAAGKAKLESVRACYGKAAKAFQAADAGRGLAAVDLRHGYLETFEGRFDEAQDHIESAARRYAACGDQMGLHLARVHRALVDISRHPALEDLETAREIGEWGRNGSYSYALGLGLMLGRAGRTALARRGDAERALACFRTAGALFRALNAELNIAQGIADQGAAHAAIGDHQAAAASYDDALSRYLARESKAGPDLATTLMRKISGGLTLFYQSYEHVADPDGIDYAVERVEEKYRKELAGFRPERVAEAIKDRRQRWRTVIDNPDAPLEALEAANEADREAHRLMALWMLRQVVQTGKVTALCYHALRELRKGATDEAEQHFEAAMRAAAEVPPGERDRLEGVVHAHRRDYPAALQAFRRSWERPADVGDEFSDALDQSGADPAAKARSRLHTLELRALTLTRLQFYAAAEEEFATLAKEFGELWWRIERSGISEILLPLAEVREHRGKLTESLELYLASVMDLEQRRGSLVIESHRIAFSAQPASSAGYLDAARAAYKAWKAASAAGNSATALEAAQAGLAYIELNHARSLADLLAESESGEGGAEATERRAVNARLSLWRGLLDDLRRNNVPDDEQEKEKRRRTIQTLSDVLLADDDALHEFERAAALRRARGSGRSEADPPGGGVAKGKETDTAARLPEGTALLQYALRGRDLVIWVVNREGIQAYNAEVEEFEIEQAIEKALAGWRSGQEQPDGARTLSSRLLEPLAGVLKRHDTLLVVPYGPMHRLPLHALLWRGEPLLATHTVATLPVASLALQPRLRPAVSGMLAAGLPAAGQFRPRMPRIDIDLPASFTRNLRELYCAIPEARLAADLAGAGVKPLVGAEVTRTALIEAIPGARVIHLATHAVLLEGAPLLSSIVLANGETLSVLDLLEMRLNAELVVLSGCRTAEGEITRGNDVLGMTRALIAAGAQSAVLSLWNVNDTSTLLLMKRFYELLARGTPIAQALRTAQLWLRELRRSEAVEEVDDVRKRYADGRAAAHLLNVRKNLADQKEERPFAAPLDWAPFTFVGRPGARW